MNIRAKLNKLGYCLSMWKTDYSGKKWMYRTSPNAGNGGSTNYFASKFDVEHYIKQVTQVREWQK